MKTRVEFRREGKQKETERFREALGEITSEAGPNGHTDGRFDEVRLRRRYGDPFTRGRRGSIAINERYYVGRFATEHRVIYELTEREFYFYNHRNGAWERRSVDEVKEMFSRDWQAMGQSVL